MDLRIIPNKFIDDFTSPYDLDVPGFTLRWWNTDVCTNETDQYLSAYHSGLEVGRAMVTHPEVDIRGMFPHVDASLLRIWFFEIREGYRGSGFGREFVHKITQKHIDSWFMVESHDAPEFWKAIGWSNVVDPTSGTDLQSIFYKSPTSHKACSEVG